jgi:predicted transcriptional regulator
LASIPNPAQGPRTRQHAVFVHEGFSGNAPIVALQGETCRTVAIRQAAHGLERLPVVAEAGSGSLVGVVSRSDLIKSSLTLQDEEHTRHRFRRWSLRPAQPI